MPQWAGSCWYFLRYLSPKDSTVGWTEEEEKYWMPVDLYVGGVEHAVLHLLYSRFWQHVLHDLGHVSTREPFQRLVNQGMILGEDHQKMSKSRGNVVNPDDMIKEYGADTLRMYEMFMGPLEQVKPWNTQSMVGVYKFLNKVWNLFIDEEGNLKSTICADEEVEYGQTEIERLCHRTVKKVGNDIDSMKFHTAIAAMMSFTNEAATAERIPRRVAEKFVLALSPFAPHIGEELWQRLGNNDTLAYHVWPEHDAELVKEDTVTIAVQVNGKLRDTIEVAVDADKDAILEAAKASSKVQAYLEGKDVKREIVVPKRLVNFVVA
jgi:leucyl-tRNA synthetase